MSRVPTIACADCGKMMAAGKTSLPQGEARCHPCRRIRPTARKTYELVCEQCGETFDRPQLQRFCSHTCASKHQTVRSEGDVHLRRTRRENAAPGLTKSNRDKLRAKWKRQGKPCAFCGAPADTIDHVLPLVRGGTNYEGNLAPACRRCNSSKSGKTVIEWRHGVTLGVIRDLPEWLGKPPPPKAVKLPKVKRQPHPCPICLQPTTRLNLCSQDCTDEHQRRYMRDKYRQRQGLAIQPDKPTKRWLTKVNLF